MTDLNLLNVSPPTFATEYLRRTNIPVRDIPTGCGACPDFIMSALTEDCWDTLNRVVKLKRIVHLLNNLAQSLTDDFLNQLDLLVETIPLPPVIDIRQIVGAVTCPLTPQALVVRHLSQAIAAAEQNAPSAQNIPARAAYMSTQFTKEIINWQKMFAEPMTIFNELKSSFQTFAKQMRAYIDSRIDLDFGSLAPFFRTCERFANEILTSIGNADIFVIKLALTTASTQMVRATCPSVYESPGMPFKQFIHETTSFSFNGLIPGGLNAAMQRFMTSLMLIEMKLFAWTAMSLTLIA
jgi:hypothetical protein